MNLILKCSCFFISEPDVNDPLSGHKSEHNLKLSYSSYQYCILMNDLQMKREQSSIDAEEITHPCSCSGFRPGFMSARFIKLMKV